MILDCCYALLATRGRDDRTFELLAAAGLRERTPSAGELSFTTALLKVMENLLQESQAMIIEQAYKSLLHLERRPYATPIRIILGGAESIELKCRKPQETKAHLNENWPLALVSLKISLSHRFDESEMWKFRLWTKTHLPRSISSITVDEVFLRTESIQKFLQQRDTSDLQVAIADDLRSRNHLETLTLQPSRSESDELRGGQGAEEVEALTALQQLREWNEKVIQSIQSNLLLSPSFYSEVEMRKLQSASAKALGLANAARLRLLNERFEDEVGLENIAALPFGQVNRVTVCDTSKSAIHTYGRVGDTIVLIEKRGYSNILPKEKVVQRVKKLARLLKEVSEENFGTAQFEGYTDEPLEGHFGLVFRTPLKSLGERPMHISLRDAYRKEKYMPLNVRLGMAVALARALSNLHAVNWLHKSLCSAHVLFFAQESKQSSKSTFRFDYSQPFLFGFDLSRPVFSSSDKTKEFRRTRQIYTHPKRWGAPQEKFNPAHDIYAMGVILLEIGCWRAANEFDKMDRRFEDINDEEMVRDELKEAAKKYLPYLAGERYCNAVLDCLSDTFDRVAGAAGDPSELHKEFRSRILEVLLRVSVGI